MEEFLLLFQFHYLQSHYFQEYADNLQNDCQKYGKGNVKNICYVPLILKYIFTRMLTVCLNNFYIIKCLREELYVLY